MGKNIIIQEGGTPKGLNDIKKIQTAKDGGGTVLWIPEDEFKTGTKKITKNGTYLAKTDSLAGYVKVLVNVPGGKSKTDSNGNLLDDDGDTVDEDGNKTKDTGKNAIKPTPSTNNDGTGKDGAGIVGKDPDGNEYYVTTDENGNIVKIKVPSSIKIVTPPTKTTYQAGQTIDYSGIAVSAYDGNEELMHTIPFSELVFTKHIVDQSSSEEYHGESWGANSEYIVSQANTYLGTNGHGDCYKVNDGNAIALWRNGQGEDDWVGPLLISPDPNSVIYNVGGTVVNPIATITYDGTTWYVNERYWTHGGNIASPLPTSEIGVGIIGDTPAALVKRISLMAMVGAWGSGGGSQKTIPVNWQRPYDNKILTDTFEITVTSSTNT